MKVLVGSINPVKINAAKTAFSKYFDGVDAEGVKVDSKVSNQPMEDETFNGAYNRAMELKGLSESRNLGADYFVGIEGGMTKLHGKYFAFGAMCVMDKGGRAGFGTSAHFELPDSISKRLLDGHELGDVMDTMLNEKNTKQKGGAIAFLTRNVMDRKELYVNGIVVALVPFINEGLYF